MSMSIQSNHTHIHPSLHYNPTPVFWPPPKNITSCQSENLYNISFSNWFATQEKASRHIQQITKEWSGLSSNDLCNYDRSNKFPFIQTVLNRLPVLQLEENEKTALNQFENDLNTSAPDFLNRITSKCGVYLFAYLSNIRAAQAVSGFYKIACAFNFPENWTEIAEKTSNQTALDSDLETHEKIKGLSSPTFYLISSFILGLGISIGVVMLKITQRINKAAYKDIALEDRQEDIEEVEQSDTSQV